MDQAVERLDALMRKLIEADQTGVGFEPLKVADELGAIRQIMFRAPTVRRAEGGQRHFRCDSCGTILHGAQAPETCPDCGGRTFYEADLEQPNVESGAG